MEKDMTLHLGERTYKFPWLINLSQTSSGKVMSSSKHFSISEDRRRFVNLLDVTLLMFSYR